METNDENVSCEPDGTITRSVRLNKSSKRSFLNSNIPQKIKKNKVKPISTVDTNDNEQKLCNINNSMESISQSNMQTENQINRTLKEVSLTDSIFCTPNPFAPLRVDDRKPQEEIQPVKNAKPPPIFINNVSNYVEFCKTLSQLLGPDSFDCKSRVDSVMLSTKTVDGYRAAIHYLQGTKAEFHTYQIKSEKAFRVVIRHLHHSTPTTIIKEDLERHNFKVRNITNVKHPTTKSPLPLFFVDLDPQENNKEIFNLRTLVYTIVKIEEPHKTTEILQCKRCQQYGHTRSYCNHNPRCVKCAGPHPSSDCTKPREQPPTCALCLGNHPANYRGCVTHKELQRLRRRTSLDRSGNRPHLGAVSHSAMPAPAANEFPQLAPEEPRHQGTSRPFNSHSPSYARVVGPSAAQPILVPPSPISNDLTSLLTTFISEFKSLITPLITLLTSLVTELIPKLSR
ncbi:uncharacterized protein isoform X2 [Rhodnius prolixus]|uniref:uncharacterized protein isoform X2 n=1 Tax=Rhodnius prolixus TaxID=13249 RepID=UPI003D18C2A7